MNYKPKTTNAVPRQLKEQLTLLEDRAPYTTENIKGDGISGTAITTALNDLLFEVP